MILHTPAGMAQVLQCGGFVIIDRGEGRNYVMAKNTLSNLPDLIMRDLAPGIEYKTADIMRKLSAQFAEQRQKDLAAAATMPAGEAPEPTSVVQLDVTRVRTALRKLVADGKLWSLGNTRARRYKVVTADEDDTGMSTSAPMPASADASVLEAA